jgi:hypothetical protein
MPRPSPQALSHGIAKPSRDAPNAGARHRIRSGQSEAFGAGQLRQTMRQRIPPIRRHPRQHLTQSRPATPPHPLRQTPPRLRRNQNNLPPARRRPITRQQPRRLHPVTQPARRRRRRPQRQRQPAQIQPPRTPDNQQRPHLRRRNRRPQLLHRPLTRLQQHRKPRLRGTHIHPTIGSRQGHLTSHQAPSPRPTGCSVGRPLDRWFRSGGTEPAGFPRMLRQASHREEASNPLQECPSIAARPETSFAPSLWRLTGPAAGIVRRF